MRKHFAFKIRPEIHHLLKIQAAKENRTMSEVFEDLVWNYTQERKEAERKIESVVKAE